MVIIGAGPIGCINIAVARVRGAKKVIVCQRSEARLNIARRFGADVVLVAAPSGEAQEQALHLSSGRIDAKTFISGTVIWIGY